MKSGPMHVRGGLSETASVHVCVAEKKKGRENLANREPPVLSNPVLLFLPNSCLSPPPPPHLTSPSPAPPAPSHLPQPRTSSPPPSPPPVRDPRTRSTGRNDAAGYAGWTPVRCLRPAGCAGSGAASHGGPSSAMRSISGRKKTLEEKRGAALGRRWRSSDGRLFGWRWVKLVVGAGRPVPVALPQPWPHSSSS
jgi:hypothetical protein